MKRGNKYHFNWQIVLLFAVPFLYFALAIYFRTMLGPPSLRSIDPDYIYFISGLGIAEGHLQIGHIDNPGTPLQYSIAAAFRITYLFRPHSSSFIQDVLLNPDLYMAIVNILLNGLIAIALFISGKFVYQKTSSIPYALLVQTAPFLPVIWYDIIGRITPELMMPIPLLAINVLLVVFLTGKSKELTNKEITLFAFLMAFGLAIKLTFIAIWAAPFLLIKSWKGKGKYLLQALLFFFIIALPVTLQLDIFWGWIKTLFMHSGNYGGGEANIINIEAFKTGLSELVRLERVFFTILLVTLFIFLVYLGIIRKKAKKKYVLFALSLFIAVLAHMLITGKHYAHRYYIPSLMLAPVFIIFSAELLKDLIKLKAFKIISNIVLILFFLWNMNYQFNWIHLKSLAIGNQVENRKETWHRVESLEEESIKIIVSQDYGSPFKEYALKFSTAWSANHLKPYYAEQLGELYPNVYQYTTWDDKFQYWGEKFNPEKYIKEGTPVYMYLEKNSEDLLNRALAKINPDNTFVINFVQTYLNENNNEVIYQLFFQ